MIFLSQNLVVKILTVKLAPVPNILEQHDGHSVGLSASPGWMVGFPHKTIHMLGHTTTAAILMAVLREYGAILTILTRK